MNPLTGCMGIAFSIKKVELKILPPRCMFSHVKRRQCNPKIASRDTVNQNFFLKKQDYTKLCFEKNFDRG
jgi:hypothetical protein